MSTATHTAPSPSQTHINALRALARGEKIPGATRAAFIRRGWADANGITSLGTAQLPLIVVEDPIEEVTPRRGGSPADFAPSIIVYQASRTVHVTRVETRGFQKHTSVDSGPLRVRLGADGEGALVTCDVTVKCWSSSYPSPGTRTIVAAVFVGDSGHVYTHRPPATNGWLDEQNPSGVWIRGRLRKLGGARVGALQQGDLCWSPLRPAEITAFGAGPQHEVSREGHHHYSSPVRGARMDLNHPSGVGAVGARRVAIRVVDEPVTVTHEPAEGAVHPPVTLPAGWYVLTVTARSLRGGGKD